LAPFLRNHIMHVILTVNSWRRLRTNLFKRQTHHEIDA
jgi:hypothetical protein